MTLALLVASLTGFLSFPAQAATLTVVNTADSGAGSLRAAIAAAAPDDTITFASGLAGQTITLASTLALGQSVTIDGSALAAPITLSGNDTVTVLSVPPGVTARLNGLTITRGKGSTYGGGIFNVGTLIVTDSTFSGNNSSEGGGIYSGGTLTVTSSTFSGNVSSRGGGVYNGGTLTVTDSTFFGNSGDQGGGIFNGVLATVSNSTVSGNIAAAGGGIYNRNMATLTLTNSTLSTNTTNNAAAAGGLDNEGTLHFANNIIANSIPGRDCVLGQSASIAANTNNLVEDGTCDAALSGDPKLAALADDGGPTQTIALLAGSPALNAADAAACAASPVNGHDQRGVARPQGEGCDIGAYEARVPTAITNPVSAVTATEAALHGTVNANDLETTVAFEYGQTTAYGTTVAASSSTLTGMSGTPVSYTLTGLAPNTTYHYRVVATNGAGRANGADETFATQPAPRLYIYLPLVVR